MARSASKLTIASTLCFCCFFLTGKLFAEGIKLTELDYKVSNKVLMAAAKAELKFNSDVLAAVQSGIPLYFDLHIKVMQPRLYIWNKERYRVKYTFSFRKHALSNQFVITNLVTGRRGVYRTIELAIDNLGEVDYLAVLDVKELSKTSVLFMEMLFELDIESLPAPMIPMAYISRSWHISSSWLRKNLDL